ncbi:hypothetical protein [Gluconobacter sphaericus]|nr:hypothetical protein [Gluconobacter sphaericus]GBR52642.1 hypothetical protein AA12467_1047 [Gluconobacter sphaericus NBRC 12467]
MLFTAFHNALKTRSPRTDNWQDVLKSMDRIDEDRKNRPHLCLSGNSQGQSALDEALKQANHFDTECQNVERGVQLHDIDRSGLTAYEIRTPAALSLLRICIEQYASLCSGDTTGFQAKSGKFRYTDQSRPCRPES